jgi:predicted small lipoprotein YifL
VSRPVRIRSACLALLALLALSGPAGCGKKGTLELPQPEPQAQTPAPPTDTEVD